MSKIWGRLSRLLTKDHHVRINETECIYNNLRSKKNTNTNTNINTCTSIAGLMAFSWANTRFKAVPVLFGKWRFPGQIHVPQLYSTRTCNLSRCHKYELSKKAAQPKFFFHKSLYCLLQSEPEYSYLSFYTLNGIDNNCNSSFRERFKTLWK